MKVYEVERFEIYPNEKGSFTIDYFENDKVCMTHILTEEQMRDLPMMAMLALIQGKIGGEKFAAFMKEISTPPVQTDRGEMRICEEEWAGIDTMELVYAEWCKVKD